VEKIMRKLAGVIVVVAASALAACSGDDRSDELEATESRVAELEAQLEELNTEIAATTEVATRTAKATTTTAPQGPLRCAPVLEAQLRSMRVLRDMTRDGEVTFEEFNNAFVDADRDHDRVPIISQRTGPCSDVDSQLWIAYLSYGEAWDLWRRCNEDEACSMVGIERDLRDLFQEGALAVTAAEEVLAGETP
jgi:hypothetical protein